MDPLTDSVDFECGLLDLFCKTNESVAKGLAGFMSYLADVLLGGQDFTEGGVLWNTAMDEASSWMGMAIIVMLITAAAGIAISILQQDASGLKRTLFFTVASIPSTYFAIYIVGQVLNIADVVSAGIITDLAGPDGFATLTSKLANASGWGVAGAIITGNAGSLVVGTMLVMFIFTAGLLCMMVALAFRNFIIMILLAFAPLAFMLLPYKGGSLWFKRWASALTAMVLAKPLMLGVYAMLFAAFGNISGALSPAAITLGIGMLVTSFMPLMAFSFFNFLGGSGGSGEETGSQASQKGKMAVSSVVRMLPVPGGGAGTAAKAGASAAPKSASGAAAGASAPSPAPAAASSGKPAQANASTGSKPSTSGTGTGAGAPGKSRPSVPEPNASPSSGASSAGGGSSSGNSGTKAAPPKAPSAPAPASAPAPPSSAPKAPPAAPAPPKAPPAAPGSDSRGGGR